MIKPLPGAPNRTPLWRTLRFRFALWTAGLLLVALVSFGAFVYLTMARSLSASVDEGLRLNASQALMVMEVEGSTLDLPDSFLESPQTAGLRDQRFILRILHPDGQVRRVFGGYHSLPVTEGSIRAGQRQQSEFATLIDPDSGETVRLYTVPIVHEEQVIGIFQVGQALTEVQDTLSRLLRALVLGISLLVLAAGGGGYWLAVRALAPIDAITRTARRISAEDLSARLSLSPTDDEVGRLGATLDSMLARLEAAFQRERQFSADASHELRTPLTAMQTILDVIRAKRRTPNEYQEALTDLAGEVDRLRGITEDLLLLARTNGKSVAQHEEIDLSTLLEDVTDSMQPLAEEKGLELSCSALDHLKVEGNRDDLIRLFANLVDNAIKYTEKGRITLAARRLAGGQAAVEVADTGTGIPAEHLPHLFERFYRVDTSRSSNGVGLGLAIAQEIARSHGAAIEAHSEVGRGTTLFVLFPASLPAKHQGL